MVEVYSVTKVLFGNSYRLHFKTLTIRRMLPMVYDRIQMLYRQISYS